jgi:hypothetical protein
MGSTGDRRTGFFKVCETASPVREMFREVSIEKESKEIAIQRI